MDMFDITLEKKIYRLEKWIDRLNREMWFLKNVYELNLTRHRPRMISKKEEQMEMFL